MYTRVCREEGKRVARVRVPRAANTGGRKYLTCVEKLMIEREKERERKIEIEKERKREENA
ncbi:hypothetical protein X777_08240 [Ooceraea biroi]|uniref:Uncharacterized protein n=1 Tax=Ooceraea biroi TaxID=2015173 RepID=A0A026WYX9_OOCBI|nr:hypothetical protein X777_08240 [Ooceraea biroi]